MCCNFKLIDTFINKKFIIDLALSRVLLENKEFPWLLLIPRRNNIRTINKLSENDATQLMKEINIASNIMEKIFKTDVLNIAAIGNKTPQLHIHIISRNEQDSLWPNVVWGQKMKNLTEKDENERCNLIKSKFKELDF